MLKLLPLWALVSAVVILSCHGRSILDDNNNNVEEASDEIETQVKRRTDQLSDMVRLRTSFNAANFIGYGNYCRGKTSGKPPIDSIDSCCNEHNRCYGAIDESIMCGGGSMGHNNYYTRYEWSDDNKNIDCKNRESKDSALRCAYDLCVCDMEFANCVANNMAAYNVDNIDTLSYGARHYARKLFKNPAIVDSVSHAIRRLLGLTKN